VSGYQAIDLIEKDVLLDGNIILNMLSKADKFFKNSNSSLKIASAMPLNFYGSLADIFHQSKDLITALELFMYAEDLISDQSDTQIIYTDNEVIFQMNHELDLVDNGLLGEFVIAIAWRHFEQFFGADVLNSIRLRHSQRCPIARYETFFNVSIEFDTIHNALVLDRSKITLPNTKGKITPTKFLIEQIQEKRRKKGLTGSDELIDVINAISCNSINKDYTVTGLANTLSVSTRNLQRRLQKENINARVLIDHFRYKYALKLLADKQYSIEKISEILGFNSEQGFQKAFKNWAGKSAAQSRKDKSNSSK